MITFDIKPHIIKPGVMVVEIRLDGKFVATLYPDKDGIRLVSAHIVDGGLLDYSVQFKKEGA